MPKTTSGGGWNPKTFEEVLAKLGGQSMLIALRVNKTRTRSVPFEADHVVELQVLLPSFRIELDTIDNPELLDEPVYEKNKPGSP
jgi:hypothetical protein